LLQVLPVVLITLGILGCGFLGFEAGLRHARAHVTNKYVDHILSRNPPVQECDFRVGGKYEPTTLFMAITGAFLAWTGNTLGLHMLYKGRHGKRGTIDPKYQRIRHLSSALRCKRRIQHLPSSAQKTQPTSSTKTIVALSLSCACNRLRARWVGRTRFVGR